MRRITTMLTILFVLCVATMAQSSTNREKLLEGRKHWALAEDLCDQNEHKKSFENYKKSAELGHPWGMMGVGMCYSNGDGVKQSDKKALEWYKKAEAALVGVDPSDEVYAPSGAFSIGDLYNYIGNRYYSGGVVAQNYKTAYDYYKRGSAAGSAWATWNLACCFYRGNGVKQDKQEAARLFAMAVTDMYRSDKVCKHIVEKDQYYLSNADRGNRYMSAFAKEYPDAAYAYDYAHWKVNPNIQRPFANSYRISPKAEKIMQQLYGGNDSQKKTSFFRQEDFLESFFVGGEDFSPKTGKSQLVRLRTLLNMKGYGEDKLSVENTKIICAYYLTHPSYKTVGVHDILSNYPEIASAKNVPLTWDGSQTINMNDAYMQYLRHLRDSSDIYALHNYFDLYHNWGDITEEEKTEDELNYVLKRDPGDLNNYYKRRFPEGHFVGMDFYKEGWAMAYVFYCQRILRKNDPKMWLDEREYRKYDISWSDWMHYPRLSRDIGEYSDDTSMSNIFGHMKRLPRDLKFNQRALSFLQELFRSSNYIFASRARMNDSNEFRSGVFRVLKGEGINEVAKIYRKLMDAIGVAVLINDEIGKSTDVTNYSYSFAKWSACHIAAEYMVDGYAAAVALAQKDAEIRPACEKAQALFKTKLALLQKKVFIHDGLWAEAIAKYNREHQANKEAYNKMRQEIENLGTPNYQYEDKTWQKQPYGEYTKKIYFPDLKDVCRSEIITDGKGTYYKAVTGAFLTTKYKTERDAIIAAYAYLKYGEVRQKGRP